MKRFIILTATLLITLAMHAQIRVLGIGNSFSQDALEQNIAEIAKSEGVPMIIANLYIGGCSIDRHVMNIKGNRPDYRYTKFDVNGKREIRQNTSLESVINEEPWDYISVQQVSGQSGIYESYAKLGELIAWIRAKAPTAKILFHQTWAYAPDSKHGDFPRYESSQEKMHAAICNAVDRVVAENDIDGIIPTGPAIQHLRKKTGNYDLTRDGYHLSLGMGRYAAACTWFARLTGRNVKKVKYYPDGKEIGTEAITEKEAKLCRKSAEKLAKKYARRKK